MAQPTPPTYADPGQTAFPGPNQPHPAADGSPAPGTPTTPLRPIPLQHASSGVPIQCQFCVGQRFRRSRLRAADIKHLLLMRYPVRCLFCNQRQMVSFTVAGVSLPSHVSQPQKRKRSSRKD